MKKVLLALLAFVVMGTAVFAQDSSNSEENNFNYTSVQIFKVLDSADAYIVTYAKDKIGRDSIGVVTIPKKWTKDLPRKLEFRTLPNGLNPYMTVIYNNGEFYKVWLTVSPNRMNKVWGVASPNSSTGDVDSVESIKLEF